MIKIKIDKEKLRKELEVKSYSYAECCGLAAGILGSISIIAVLCMILPPLFSKLVIIVLIIAAAICSLGYLIYKLVN